MNKNNMAARSLVRHPDTKPVQASIATAMLLTRASVMVMTLAFSSQIHASYGQSNGQSETRIGFGPGVNGANRRVRTQTGAAGMPWVRVRGHFTEPTVFSVPRPGNNPHRSGPDLYLGSEGSTPGTEVDAGLHFNPEAQQNAPVGWSLYINALGRYTFCGRGQAVYTWNKYSLGTVELTYHILSTGSVELEARIPNSSPSGYFHMYPGLNGSVIDAGDSGPGAAPPVYPTNGGFITTPALNGIALKRVVAMTQSDLPGGPGRAAYIDGSFMNNAVWTQGEIGHATAVNPNVYNQDPESRVSASMGTWTSSGRHLDLAQTGFVPVGIDERRTLIVRFVGISDSNRLAVTSSRYANETTHIHLRKRQAMHGNRVVPATATRVTQ